MLAPLYNSFASLNAQNQAALEKGQRGLKGATHPEAVATEKHQVAETAGCHGLHWHRVTLKRQDEEGDVGGLHVQLGSKEAVQPKDPDRLLSARNINRSKLGGEEGL